MPPPPKPSAAPPGAQIVIAAGTSRWARALPGVAFRLGGRIDTHATDLAAANGAPALTRWFYRQRMEAVLTRTQRPWFVLLDPGCVPAWTGAPGTATVEAVTVEPPATRTTVTGSRRPRPTNRPSARTPKCSSSPAPAGPRSRPTAQPTPPKPSS